MTVAVEKTLKSAEAASAAAEDAPGREPAILVVGNVSQWQDAGRRLPVDADISFADFSDISADLLEILRPEIILSPLMCGTFDCLDLAQVLHEAGYRGRYRVMAPVLPDPDLIKAEIQGLCPSLDFCFIFTTDEFGRRLS